MLVLYNQPSKVSLPIEVKSSRMQRLSLYSDSEFSLQIRGHVPIADVSLQTTQPQRPQGTNEGH